jgi:hypothetical protein
MHYNKEEISVPFDNALLKEKHDSRTTSQPNKTQYAIARKISITEKKKLRDRPTNQRRRDHIHPRNVITLIDVARLDIWLSLVMENCILLGKYT